MLRSSHRVLNNLNYLSYIIPEPTIGTQPTLFLPKCLQLGDCEESVGEGKTTSIGRDLQLRFSVDFHNSINNELNDISENFDLKETKIVLQRFIKKSFKWERFDDAIHSSEEIVLPALGEETGGFRLYIGDKPCTSDIGNIKRGSQIISLHTSMDRITQTIDERSLIISLFKDLLGIENDTTKVAYRFSIHLKWLHSPQIGILRPPLLTDMFKIKFSTHEYMAILETVKPEDYHLGNS